MARWIQDPQYREEVDEVSSELKLPIYKASAKGKFRNWFKESWNKIEDYLVSLKQSLQEQINGKEPSFYKKSGFNLEKTDDYEYDRTNELATGRALYKLWKALEAKIKAIKLTWNSIQDKPETFPPNSHNHDDRYYSESEIDEKLGEKSNVVKKVWSGMYTQKGGIVCSLPSGWKVVFIQISWHSTYRGSTTTETLFKDTYQLKGFGVGDEGSSEYTIEIDYYGRVKFAGRGQGDDAAIEAVHVI